MGVWKNFILLTGKGTRISAKLLYKTQKKSRDAGYSVRRIRGCEWNKIKKNSQVAAYIKTLKTVQPCYQLSYQKILDEIQDGSLYGFLLVDIETPDHLKPKLADFPPIIKNTESAGRTLALKWQKLRRSMATLKNHSDTSLPVTLAKTFSSTQKWLNFIWTWVSKSHAFTNLFNFTPASVLRP